MTALLGADGFAAQHRTLPQRSQARSDNPGSIARGERLFLCAVALAAIEPYPMREPRGGKAHRRFSFTLSRWGLDPTQTAILIAILVVTAILYLPSLRDGFVYDDLAEIVQNRLIGRWPFIWQSFAHDSWWFRIPHVKGQSAYYRPIQNVWLGVVFHLFGKDPIGWHAAKIVMHLAVVLLSFRLAQLLSGDFATAAITAALFAIHPVHAEAVTWITAVPEVLAAIFVMWAMVLDEQRRRGLRTRIGSYAIFTLALLSHEGAILFPLVFAARAFLWPQEDDAQLSMRARILAGLRETWPFFALSIVLLGVRAVVLGQGFLGLVKTRGSTVLVHRKIVVRRQVISRTPADLVLNLPMVILKDLMLVALPWMAAPAHEVYDIQSPFAAGFLVPGVILAALGCCFVLWTRRSECRLYAFGAVWFAIALAPALSLNQVVSPIQDRYLYVASFGMLLGAGLFGARLIRSRPARLRAATMAVGAALAITCAVFLWRIQPIWNDNVSLFRAAVEDFPTSMQYRMAYGLALESSGDREGAVQQYLAAARLNPADAHPYHRLGELYEKMGKHQESQAAYHEYFKRFAPWAVPDDQKAYR
jgi:hypothetical protein